MTSSAPAITCLAHLTAKPLTWLWPGRIPLGHLTLLDAAPGSGLSLCALTLAACLSNGSPLPDGTPTQPTTILLIAPYDTPEDTILPRFLAAGGDPTRLVLYRPTIQETPQTTVRYRTLDLPRDLDHLTATIQQLDVRLVIIDPASSVTGLTRCLPALLELAHQTHCAILLARSLRQPPADPLHTPASTSPLLTAARSRLLLTSDPADPRHHLLLTTKHSLSAPSSILSYEIQATETSTPILHWFPERDRTSLERLCTGPIRSLHRQAILQFLHDSPTPQHIKAILSATSYDYEAGRKMLVRMKMAGELVSLDHGLYTTAGHPCLASLTATTPPVPNVPGNLFPSTSSNTTTPLPAASNASSPDPPSTDPHDSQNEMFKSKIARGQEALAEIRARLAASGHYPPPTLNTPAPCPDSSQQPPDNITPTASPFPTTTPNPQSQTEPVPTVPDTNFPTHFIPWTPPYTRQQTLDIPSPSYTHKTPASPHNEGMDNQSTTQK